MAPDFQKLFVDRVAAIRALTDGAGNPAFNALKSVDLEEVTSLISSLQNKQCRSDLLPTWLLKECTSELVPFIRRFFNASLRSGRVPQSFKSAYITPLLKKVGLDNTDIKNYQPISNLTVTSKMLERVILQRLLEHLKVNGLFPSVQSAYRKYHSTETAMARVISDILMALDRDDVAALALLDLSAAFDMVDHSILLRHLRESYGISGRVLTWINSYLTDRQQSVCHAGMLSAQEYIKFGVPQGSVPVASEPGGIGEIDLPVVNPGGIIPPLCRQNCVQKLRYMGANNYE